MVKKENQERKMDATIKVSLDLPNVEVLQTAINQNGDSIITVKSRQKGTNCKDCGKEIDKFHAYDKIIEARHLSILNRRVYIRMRLLLFAWLPQAVTEPNR
jgi:transposase